MKKLNKNIGIVLNPSGHLFGGAQKRFTNLFHYLSNSNPNKVYYFVSEGLYIQIKKYFPNYELTNIIILKDLNFKYKFKKSTTSELLTNNKQNKSHFKSIPRISLFKKIITYFKNYIKQYYLFLQIGFYQKKFNIKTFLGIYNGILPLYFFLNNRKRNIGIIFSDMDSWFFEVKDKNQYQWFEKYNTFNFGLENSDIVEFLSPYILEGVQERKLLLNPGKTKISPCSFSNYENCLIGDKKEFIIAYAARIAPDKNPLLYLQAAYNIISKYPNVKFYLLGEGLDYLHIQIEAFIKQNNLSNHIYFGFHPNPVEIFKESTVFVSIQTTNNYPSQSVLEAMACGNAIIASDVGDTRMFVNETVGYLISLNEKSLTEVIEKCIINKDFTLQLGKNARDFVLKNHTIEKFAEFYIDLFNQL